MIKAFEEKSVFYDARLTECSKIHARFIKRWPRERLDELLTLESYVIGAGDHDTFCYWIERETRLLGSILGATASKFKVYYDHEKKAYEYVAPFGSAQEAFIATKAAILDLLNAADRDDMEAIKGIKLLAHSHLLRGKLLHLYFPEKFICIFSEEDIDYFLDRLGVAFDPSEHVIQRSQKLLEYKNDSAHFRGWPSRKFMYFLYDQLVPPSRCRASGDSKPSKTDVDLRKQEGLFVLPRITDTRIELVEFGRIVSGSGPKGRRGGKTNYIVEAVRNTKLGNHGEDLVVVYEQEILRAAKRADLAKKVRRVSIEDDSFGYDIESFMEDGSRKFIEVKSTTSTVDANVPFFVTENERQKMKELGDRYFVYRLMSANTKTPKLIILNASQFSERCRMETKLWQVSFVAARNQPE
jgi:hypothetical protein